MIYGTDLSNLPSSFQFSIRIMHSNVLWFVEKYLCNEFHAKNMREVGIDLLATQKWYETGKDYQN